MDGPAVDVDAAPGRIHANYVSAEGGERGTRKGRRDKCRDLNHAHAVEWWYDAFRLPARFHCGLGDGQRKS
jgi:hypothetical protein